jgi:hypothetical protein
MPRTLALALTVPEPATTVTLLHWAYRDQKADIMSGRGLYLPETTSDSDEDYHGGWSNDGCAAMEIFGRVGALIPSTDHLQRPALHEDAAIVHDLVVALSRDDPAGALLLQHHGRQGDMPDISDLVPHPEPVHHRIGRREVIIDDATIPGQSHLERRRIQDPVTRRRRWAWIEVFHPFCPLSYWPTPTAIAKSRIEYQVWWRALRRLTTALPPLRRWIVSGPGAEECPWHWMPLVPLDDPWPQSHLPPEKKSA